MIFLIKPDFRLVHIARLTGFVPLLYLIQCGYRCGRFCTMASITVTGTKSGEQKSEQGKMLEYNPQTASIIPFINNC